MASRAIIRRKSIISDYLSVCARSAQSFQSIGISAQTVDSHAYHTAINRPPVESDNHVTERESFAGRDGLLLHCRKGFFYRSYSGSHFSGTGYGSLEDPCVRAVQRVKDLIRLSLYEQRQGTSSIQVEGNIQTFDAGDIMLAHSVEMRDKIEDTLDLVFGEVTEGRQVSLEDPCVRAVQRVKDLIRLSLYEQRQGTSSIQVEGNIQTFDAGDILLAHSVEMRDKIEDTLDLVFGEVTEGREMDDESSLAHSVEIQDKKEDILDLVFG